MPDINNVTNPEVTPVQAANLAAKMQGGPSEQAPTTQKQTAQTQGDGYGGMMMAQQAAQALSGVGNVAMEGNILTGQELMQGKSQLITLLMSAFMMRGQNKSEKEITDMSQSPEGQKEIANAYDESPPEMQKALKGAVDKALGIKEPELSAPEVVAPELSLADKLKLNEKNTQSFKVKQVAIKAPKIAEKQELVKMNAAGKALEGELKASKKQLKATGKELTEKRREILSAKASIAKQRKRLKEMAKDPRYAALVEQGTKELDKLSDEVFQMEKETLGKMNEHNQKAKAQNASKVFGEAEALAGEKKDIDKAFEKLDIKESTLNANIEEQTKSGKGFSSEESAKIRQAKSEIKKETKKIEKREADYIGKVENWKAELGKVNVEELKALELSTDGKFHIKPESMKELGITGKSVNGKVKGVVNDYGLKLEHVPKQSVRKRMVSLQRVGMKPEDAARFAKLGFMASLEKVKAGPQKAPIPIGKPLRV